MAVGSARPLEDSWRIGNVEMVRWLEELYSMHVMDAYQLLSQISLAPIANVVDANYSVVVKAPKSILPTASAYGGIHADLRARARSLT
jgi:acetamidase/formamidase